MSLKLCDNLKKEELKLNNLRYILRISSQFALKPLDALQKISEEAFMCSKEYAGVRTQDILRCNIGILRGLEEFYQNSSTQQEI